jgi:hypothetical protein
MHFNEFFALLDAAGLSILLHGVMRLEQDLIKIDGEEASDGNDEAIAASSRKTAC